MSARPNVLIIYADQHRADCLGAYGNEEIRTPALDALAAGGTVFENSFCSYPACTPSRYSFLSGLPVWRHAGWSNHSTLSPDIETFPRIMRRTGYRTTAVGKMHFTPTYLDVGFDHLRLCEQDGNGRWDDDYHRMLMENDLIDLIDLADQRGEYRRRQDDAYWESWGSRESDLDEEHHSTTWIAQQALDEISTWHGDGNLLMVGFVKPHHPMDPPAPWSTMYDPAKLTLLPGWTEQCLDRDLAYRKGYFPHDKLTPEATRRTMAMYYATISQIDHWCAKLFDELKSRGLYDDTLIVYTADHGDYMGFHHMMLKGNHMYDPLMRVPLLMKQPGQSTSSRTNALVSCTDAAPTILSVAGCDRSDSMRGLDLTGDLTGHHAVLADGSRGRDIMVRTKSRKLLLRKEEELLFDLEEDPLELSDVSADAAYADDLARLRETATTWRDADASSETYVDERAPRIAAGNVPDIDDDHRERISGWYARKADATGRLNPHT
jgi:arylsulfatase A-like enzyme